MEAESIIKTITESAREIKVVREADVVVVGGGPGGIGASLAAARNGAKTVLIERYGHLGGMASGGLVNIFPNLSDISGKQHIFGINQEIIDRLAAKNAAFFPKKEDWGTTDKKIVDYYKNANMGLFYVRKDPNIGNRERVMYTAVVDPEILKGELDLMMEEAGVDLLFHSWGTRPIMDGDTVTGVFFESKSGRQAITAKIVIDATGDGDIFVAAGAEFDSELNNKFRTAWLAFTFWLSNVDIQKVTEFEKTNPEKHAEMMQEVLSMGGYGHYFKGLLKNQDGVIWFHNFLIQPESSDTLDVEELTRVNLQGRKGAIITYEFYRKNIPGFEKSFIMQTAPQLGTQGGRRIIGEYILKSEDMESDEIHEDTIAVLANNDNFDISAKHPSICIPYRCLVPVRVDGLLVACRAFSSSDDFNQWFNIIPPCICYGQAAGTAAALAVQEGIQPRNVDYGELKSNLISQGVNIPD